MLVLIYLSSGLLSDAQIQNCLIVDNDKFSSGKKKIYICERQVIVASTPEDKKIYRQTERDKQVTSLLVSVYENHSFSM